MTAEATYPALDALIADLAENEDEWVLMSHAAEMLAYAASEATPPAGMFSRILGRIAVDSEPATFERDGFFFSRGEKNPWITIQDGNNVKFLWQQQETGARVLVVNMPPNTEFPAHSHDLIEDLYVVDGEAWVAGVLMRRGDYCRAPVGTAHTDLRSGPAGVVAFVVQR